MWYKSVDHQLWLYPLSVSCVNLCCSPATRRKLLGMIGSDKLGQLCILEMFWHRLSGHDRSGHYKRALKWPVIRQWIAGGPKLASVDNNQTFTFCINSISTIHLSWLAWLLGQNFTFSENKSSSVSNQTTHEIWTHAGVLFASKTSEDNDIAYHWRININPKS